MECLHHDGFIHGQEPVALIWHTTSGTDISKKYWDTFGEHTRVTRAEDFGAPAHNPAGNNDHTTPRNNAPFDIADRRFVRYKETRGRHLHYHMKQITRD